MASENRRHRGAHPQDREQFREESLPSLRAASADLSWLLSRGYSQPSALKLVGDRHGLRARQRLAVQRCACSDQAWSSRTARCAPAAALAGAALYVDGFNLIVTLEAALSGGLVLEARDGCLRDLASVHGSYRAVAETEAAIQWTGRFLAGHAPRQVVWLLDRPVSNSGRLRRRLEQTAAAHGWPWSVRLAYNPDAELREADGLVVTSDSTILDAGVRWTNLARALLVAGPSPDRLWLVRICEAGPQSDPVRAAQRNRITP